MRRNAWGFGIAIAGGIAVILSLPNQGTGASQRAALRSSLHTGADVYEAACASCHGVDGRGAPHALLGFDVPLPDFSDCSFVTREPEGDWFGIVHDGGPTRAFDKLMPAFGEALTDDQINKSLEHVRSFCGDDNWPRGDLNLPRPLITEKAYPEDELVLELAGSVEEPYAVSADLVFEKRLGARSQVEIVLPFAVHQVQSGDSNDLRWGEGAGDIALGFKTALLHSMRTGSIFSFGAEVFFPTGDEKDALSTGTFKFEPYLAFGQIIPIVGFIHLQGGAELSADPDAAGHEAFWRGAFGRSFSQRGFGRTWTPMVEVVGGMELESGAAPEWDVVPQLQVTLNRRQNIMANVGVMIPVSDFGPRQTQVMAYLLWDWFDGGLTEGW